MSDIEIYMEKTGFQEYLDSMFKGFEPEKNEIIGRIKSFDEFDEEFYQKIIDASRNILNYFYRNPSFKGPGTSDEELLGFTLGKYLGVTRVMWNFISVHHEKPQYVFEFIETSLDFLMNFKGDVIKYEKFSRNLR